MDGNPPEIQDAPGNSGQLDGLFFWRPRDPDRLKSWAWVLEEEAAVLQGHGSLVAVAPRDLVLERCAFEEERKDKLRHCCAELVHVLRRMPARPRPRLVWFLLEDHAWNLAGILEIAAEAYGSIGAAPAASPEDRVQLCQRAWMALDEGARQAGLLLRGLNRWRRTWRWRFLGVPGEWHDGFAKMALALEAGFMDEQAWMDRLTAHLEQRNHAALCLSGGGIRSASFSLGVLEALQESELLTRFHYLSTVSGGGFTGAWLQAWFHRNGSKKAAPEERVEDTLKKRAEETLKELAATTRPWTAPHLDADGQDRFAHGPEPTPFAKPVWWVRCFGRYLSPRTGLLSGDALTLVATLVRNLALHWVILLPLLAGALLLPRLVKALLSQPLEAWVPPALLLAGVLALLGGFSLAAGAVPGSNASDPSWKRASRKANLSIFLAFLGCILLAGSIIPQPPGSATAEGRMFQGPFKALASAPPGFQRNLRVGRLVTLGPPLFALALLAVLAGGVGLLSRSRKVSDLGREWSAAYGGRLLGAALCWLAYFGIALYGTHWVDQAPRLAQGFAALTGVSLPVALWAMISSQTGESRGQQFRIKAFLAGKAAVLGGAVGCLALVLGMNILLDMGLAAWQSPLRFPPPEAPQSQASSLTFTAEQPPGRFSLTVKAAADKAEGAHHAQALEAFRDQALETPWVVLLIAASGLLAFGIIAAWFVPLNHFTLHELYRNRLTRAFLGASNPRRRADAFTGMDASDDIPLLDLRQEVLARGCLLPVLNATLNTVHGEKLGWQDRKGRPFTFSPWHCGSPYMGYRDTGAYGGGVTLATAVTVSGAALNPAMGYHTSPFLSALMTLFSVRLGIWLGNPGPPGDKALGASTIRSVYQLGSPLFYPAVLLAEALGRTRQDYRYVNLSDGGHFENLGIHAMLGRRCRMIVVVDASEDPEFEYEDLGRLVRLARLDHGVKITFPRGLPCPPGKGVAKFGVKDCGGHVAHGVIDYAGKARGDLIYIKPIVRGDEPEDVLTYALGAPPFPHQPTLEQFFGEAQFEAYRALGHHSVRMSLEGSHRPYSLEAWAEELGS